MVEKSATISKLVDAASQVAVEPTCVSRVGVHSPITGAPVVVRAAPLLSVRGWYQAGLDTHPDKEFVNKIISGTRYGVNINYKGPCVTRECPNWKSVDTHRTAVLASLRNDTHLGKKCGPFPFPPFDPFVVSPMGAFQRKRSLKHRIIHDLSWPPGESINDFIDVDESSVTYMSVDDVTTKLKSYGPGSYMATLDLADAYKSIRVRPEDWHLLGAVWITDTGDKQYYFDQTLPFGLRSSAKIFTEFAKALKYVMIQNGASHVEQYLDDFITCAPTKEQCETNLRVMIDTCNMIGFTVNPRKISYPTTVIEFLGLVIDSIKMETRISQERLCDIITELLQFKNRRWCTKRQLLSLIGKLVFISRVVKSGRSFVRRMIETSKHIKHLHHRVRLKRHFRDDIRWWLQFLPTWNGVSIVADDIWNNSSKLQLFTDASDTAVSAYFNGQWCILPYELEMSYLREMSINFGELFAIIMAMCTWGNILAGTKILLFCDNLSVCQIINSGVSKNVDIMKLVRTLFFVCASFSIECRAVHISSFHNAIADSLSRLDFIRFKLLTLNKDTEQVAASIIDWFLL